MTVIKDRIQDLETRNAQLNKSRQAFERERAVLEGRYDQSVELLMKLGYDVSEMKASQIRALKTDLETKLEKQVEAIEKAIQEGEDILEKHQEGQG